MTARNTPVKNGFKQGIDKGWHGFLWMLKILVPISFLTAILQWSGWLHRMDFIIHPLMDLLNLPPAAALPLIIGILTSIYGGIAAMVILPFTIEQMTLMAIFLLIAHNMIQEGVIQAKSGIHPLKATLFRLAAAVITVIIVGQFLDTRSAVPMTSASPVSSHQGPFIEMLQNWGLATLLLSAKIFVIIMALLTLLEVLKELGWIHTFVNWLAPFLVVLGLDRKTGILWLTAVVFGLAYGAAVIVEEAGRGDLSGEELERLHLSIGINHSMVEDPILFMALGLSAFWLWVPRLVIAVVAVHLLRLWHWSRQRVSVGAVQQ